MVSELRGEIRRPDTRVDEINKRIESKLDEMNMRIESNFRWTVGMILGMWASTYSFKCDMKDGAHLGGSGDFGY